MGSTVIRGWNTTCAKEEFKCLKTAKTMFNLLLNGSRSLVATMGGVGQHESRVKL